MARGKALFIGINDVDPDPKGHYRGWNGHLNFPESDAQSMAKIGEARGFEGTILLGSDASRAAIKDSIALAADELENGDTFLIFYSGHGNTYPDPDGEAWDGGTDETLCAYDHQLLDDELTVLWPKFDEGVRVLFLLDACHSGGMLDGAALIDEGKPKTKKQIAAPEEQSARGLFAKTMDPKSAETIVQADPEAFKNIRKTLPGAPKPEDVVATVRQISACMDTQLSYENKKLRHGQFTAALLAVWGQTGFRGNYGNFFRAIDERMPTYDDDRFNQSPGFRRLGPGESSFDGESPFTI